jgi:elongation factor P
VVLAGDLRKNSKLIFKKEPYSVISFQHVKPGKGGAFARIKMKNLMTGLVHEHTFRTEEKLDTPDLEYKDMLYVYQDGDEYQFLDQESFEQVGLTKSKLGDAVNYLKEQVVYTVLYFNDKPIEVNPPLFVGLEVIETPPGVKGDTAQGGGNKPATLQTGLVLQVPLFINEGDALKVDTRDGKYIERVKK